MVTIAALFISHPGQAESLMMASAPPGLVETGAPAFAVLGPEAMGLKLAPTDLHCLPDGRILVVAQRELAFSDGVRWEVFRTPEGGLQLSTRVAVDSDGLIYASIEGGMGRVDFKDDAHWELTQVAELPRERSVPNTTMSYVVESGNNWYWYGTGLVQWRPGQPVRATSVSIPAVGMVFTIGQDVFMCSWINGALVRLAPDGSTTAIPARNDLASEAVTCAVPFAPGQVLVGTASGSLKLFDGKTFLPFGPSTFSGGQQVRIMDLCVVNDTQFAAAVDTVGIVFFNREGHVLQVLERSLDHRLRRVRRVVAGRDGVVWALLNDGVARVQFPSPVSYFEPLLPGGLEFAKPIRHAGNLWMLADGRALRGIYTASGRLDRFEEDSPPGKFLFTLTDYEGELLGANETGIFRRTQDKWELIAPGIVNARIGFAQPRAAGWPYIARGEYGFVRRDGDRFTAQRIPVNGMADNYNAIEDKNGIVWVELGTGRAARIDYHSDHPTLDLLGQRDGLFHSWVETYLLEGRGLIHVSNRLLRYDETLKRFVDEQDLPKRFPMLPKTYGRPVLDAFGRFWYSRDERPHLQMRDANGVEVDKTLEVSFAPTGFAIEEQGVGWLTAAQHLVRYDSRVTAPPTSVPRALITSIQFSASGRYLFSPGSIIPPLLYADNSLVFHFAAPANPFAPPVNFEVLLEGAGTTWTSTGTVASAAFQRLKEGRYVFHVRPVTGGDQRGAETRVAFEIRPPWYRSLTAWIIYVVSTCGLFGGIVWLIGYLHRRENERLEHLVTKRTEELATSNLKLGQQITETMKKSAALSASEERYRTLNADLEKRVGQRTAELSASNAELQQRESLFRLIFEHAPVGIFWKRTDLGGAYHLNATFRRILNLPDHASTNGTPMAELIHPEDAARHASLNGEIQSGKRDSFNVDVRLLLADRRTVWGSLSVAVVRDKQGHIVQDIGILEDISGRKNAEEELAKTYKNLMDASRTAGMAEVATGVLHNVGNVLNSLNVSSSMIAARVRRSKVDTLVKLAAMINENVGRLGEFLEQDAKGKLIPEFITNIATHSMEERDWLVEEIVSMQKNIDHIKEIVIMQQGYASAAGVVEELDPAELFEDALRMSGATLAREDLTIVRRYARVPRISVSKGKVLQILVNLIRNAKHACDQATHDPARKTITLRIEPAGADKVRLAVEDNGIGIPAENLTRIFVHGFTTRANGHGFGLHSSAIAAKEMQGSLAVFSGGDGQGATFTLELPVTPEGESAELPRTVASATTV